MKSKLFIFIVLNLIVVSLLLAQKKACGNGLLIFIQNEKIDQLSKEVNALKEQIIEAKDTNTSSIVKFLPIFVSGIAFIASLVLTVFTFMNNTVNKQFKESIENVELRIKKIRKKIKKKSKGVEKSSKEIKQLNKELSSHETYLKESIELLFELNSSLANMTKNKKFLKTVHVKRAVSSLYSSDKNERFSGITTLGESGGAAEIKHLEHIIVDEKESANNKLLAHDAMAKIESRKRK